MAQTNKLFHVCHLLFSNGITKPESALTFEELEKLIHNIPDYNLEEIIKELVEQGYVGQFNDRYFLLGKGIIAVAAIFT
ncbi:MAG: hypothetical protein K9W42_04475 [Candidatus Heimdallarchaeota archaeon]|nr:hypothetical protein [Candidatus Heimdallarchaeota archaeon]